MVLYEHFNDHLIISCNRYFDDIIPPVPFWDFPLLLSLSQSNIFTLDGNHRVIFTLDDCITQVCQ